MYNFRVRNIIFVWKSSHTRMLKFLVKNRLRRNMLEASFFRYSQRKYTLIRPRLLLLRDAQVQCDRAQVHEQTVHKFQLEFQI